MGSDDWNILDILLLLFTFKVFKKWQITLCVLENFLGNFATTSNQNEFVGIVAMTKFYHADKDFQKILQCSLSDLSLQWVAQVVALPEQKKTCCGHMLPDVS